MTIASELLHRHFQTLVADHAQWQTLIADDLVWELPYALALGHPARLSGRAEVMRHVTWFLGAVEQFRFFDLQVYACADPDAAVAEVQAEARIKPTGRLYRQAYVVILRAAQIDGSDRCSLATEEVDEFRDDLIRRFFHQPVPRMTDDDAFNIRRHKPALLDQEIA